MGDTLEDFLFQEVKRRTANRGGAVNNSRTTSSTSTTAKKNVVTNNSNTIAKNKNAVAAANGDIPIPSTGEEQELNAFFATSTETSTSRRASNHGPKSKTSKGATSKKRFLSADCENRDLPLAKKAKKSKKDQNA
ncbi:unnamed protein product, partial [Amoebophrya sp. A25]|eukprot:GSA25T00017382001.1